MRQAGTTLNGARNTPDRQYETVKAIGLTLSPAFLDRVDEVIE
jgi:hypothetical protein